MTADLLLDPQIRWWVILPILAITFLSGISRHYVSILISSSKKPKLERVKATQAVARSRLLRQNGHFIPHSAFQGRRHFFCAEEDGLFHKEEPQAATPNPATDPMQMMDMMKGNFVNMVPMLAIGGLINYAFSGFVIIKVPFPLTLPFKSMLQRGIELTSLSASWVSSMSLYFVCVFGLRSIFTLILGEQNSASQSLNMQQPMAVGAMGPDMKAAFTDEIDALRVISHKWALKGVELELANSDVTAHSKDD